MRDEERKDLGSETSQGRETTRERHRSWFARQVCGLWVLSTSSIALSPCPLFCLLSASRAPIVASKKRALLISFSRFAYSCRWQKALANESFSSSITISSPIPLCLFLENPKRKLQTISPTTNVCLIVDTKFLLLIHKLFT